jgi:prepilin-type N-terminal cleavage/methylation domain-containing protein
VNAKRDFLRRGFLRPGFSKQGFSMLELLVVIAVLGILLAIGGWSGSRYIAQMRLNEAKQTAIDAVSKTANDAIKQTRRLTLAIENSNSRLVWREGTTLVGQQTMPEGSTVAIQAQQNAGTPILFTSRGIPDQQVTFRVTRGSSTKDFTLLITGLVVQQ